ncbi:cutinase [Geopyxis carbonaria]|nr:cutinase [Geopyxis carbonaria]
MQLLSLLPALLAAGTAIAAPAASNTADDFLTNGCSSVMMLYARASTETGNIGSTVGPELSAHLHALLPSFGMQGVVYPALLADNLNSGGTTPEAVDAMVSLLTRVATECPDSTIVAGGYSQGSAVVARGLMKAAKDVRARVKAVVMFGYTQNKQLKGTVPGMEKSSVKVYCNPLDLICSGSLVLTPTHFTYTGKSTKDAANFVVSRIPKGSSVNY